MSTVSLDEKVPDFELPATGDQSIRLSELRGGPVVVYFYPKDSTPGCTKEGQDFSEFFDDFLEYEAFILGVSRDGMAAHERFKASQEFPFDLLSDADGEVCELFDVIREKNMYGRRFMGIERSTFLIDGDGVLRREWRKVRVRGHVEEVLDALDEL